MEIYKTLNVPVKCSKQEYLYLLNCNKLSAEAWNKILEIEKEYRKTNDGNWIDRNQLQKELKGFVHLHAKGAQHVIGKYLAAREAALKAKKEGRKDVLFPYKSKKYFVTGWTYQDIKVKDNKILLGKPMTKELIDGKQRRQKPVSCYVKNIPDNIVQIELIYKNKLYLSIKYKEQSEYLKIQSSNHASIDLGEIHSITSIDSCGNALIITGRKMRAIRQLRNKHQAKIYKRMSKCTKGSKQYWKYRKAMKKLSIRYEREMLAAIYNTRKLFLCYCIENNISTVYYGDLDSATRNTKIEKKVSNYTRQKLTQWNFGQLMEQVENKLNKHGIKLIKVKEYYTSKKCPKCKELNKPTNREYKCKCGYEQHRDIVGAINILNDNAGTNLTKYKTKKYLRIA